MKLLISALVVCLVSIAGDADAGVLFDRYIRSAQALVEAQQNHPDHIITLTGQQNDLANAALNYNNFESALTEIKNEKYSGDKLRDMYVLAELMRRPYSPNFIDPASPNFAEVDKKFV